MWWLPRSILSVIERPLWYYKVGHGGMQSVHHWGERTPTSCRWHVRYFFSVCRQYVGVNNYSSLCRNKQWWRHRWRFGFRRSSGPGDVITALIACLANYENAWLAKMDSKGCLCKQRFDLFIDKGRSMTWRECRRHNSNNISKRREPALLHGEYIDWTCYYYWPIG